MAVIEREAASQQRLPGELAHPRLFGLVMLAASAVALGIVATLARNTPLEPGRYGRIYLRQVHDPRLLPALAVVVILGVAVTALVMVLRRRPANRTAAVVMVASLAGLVVAGLLMQPFVVELDLPACPSPTQDHVRETWADRPTVGEALTGGLLDGNAADAWFLGPFLPEGGGCGQVPGL